ncbi:arsenic resistance protein [Thorsellia kenyensis]|uniref:Arsenic resistance protein n=1 Tax=Thorsellia kenyensis TaxID=1549888 RepID=A0ABV6C6N1_9GAMM
MTEITVPWKTLLISVILNVLLLLVFGILARHYLDKFNDTRPWHEFNRRTKPFAILRLLATVILISDFQTRTIIINPLAIVLIVIPFLIQTCGIFLISYFFAKRIKLSHKLAAPACMIGTSNFFKLAVALAISLFGLKSGAPLAIVVGVLVKVPGMLSLVAFANKTWHWLPKEKT